MEPQPRGKSAAEVAFRIKENAGICAASPRRRLSQKTHHHAEYFDL